MTKQATTTKARRKAIGRGANNRTAEGLNVQQQAFRDALMEGITIAEAGRRAGYTPQHCSRLLQNPTFAEALKAGQAKLAEAGVCSKIELMREAWKIGSSDIRQLMDADGGMLHPHEWPDDIARAVSSLDVMEIYEGEGKNRKFVGMLKKVRLHPKMAAIDTLAKMLGAFAAPKEPVGPDGKPIPARRMVVVVPAKKTEEQMAGYGSQAQALAQREAKPLPPMADDAPVPKHAVGKLRRLKVPAP